MQHFHEDECRWVVYAKKTKHFTGSESEQLHQALQTLVKLRNDGKYTYLFTYTYSSVQC